ncbi:MAG: hypothetical protein NT019_02680 [Candidatus Adlerbacteria bacterium]|nr:hypothetical protein [Candidatus Adlerbacteria bacterium]
MCPSNNASALCKLVAEFSKIVVNPLLGLLFAGGLLVFMFGVAEFLFEFNVQGNQSSKEAGKQHMLWGVIGMFIMVSAWAILKLIAGVVGQTI